MKAKFVNEALEKNLEEDIDEADEEAAKMVLTHMRANQIREGIYVPTLKK